MSKKTSNTNVSQHCAWSAAHFTHIGKVRKVNEDSLLANTKQGHWAVADGMGGHDRGDVASQAIVEALDLLDKLPEFSPFSEVIGDCLTEVNQQLLQLGSVSNSVIGSTVAGLVIQQQHVFCYWAGDSRVYRLRDKKLQQLTVDHTLTQQLVEQGKLNADEARHHRDRNVVTRAVGAYHSLSLDFKTTPLEPNDWYLVCSDGIEKEMSDEEVETLLNEHGHDIELAGQQLLDEVLKRGARDNVAFVLIALFPLT